MPFIPVCMRFVYVSDLTISSRLSKIGEDIGKKTPYSSTCRIYNYYGEPLLLRPTPTSTWIHTLFIYESGLTLEFAL